jgi:acyl dehydratase
MLWTGARVVAHTLSAKRASSRPQQQIAPVERVIAALPPALVEAYLAWTGAEGDYAGQLPPHMVSQWSLPLVGELLLRMPYKLTSVINQGVGLHVHGPLPRNIPLHLRAAVEQIEETAGRIKVVVLVTTGTAEQPVLLETRLHMSFLLPGPRPAKPAREQAARPRWTSIGRWQASARDGLHFALLTGDFNPIHWCGPLARRSVFRGLVLHGFGSFVRSYELLRRQGVRFSEIDVRFVKPVPLPCSTLSVQIADAAADGWRAIRLAGADDTIHLAGNLR